MTAIVVAGPIVTAALAVLSLLALHGVEISLGETPELESAAGVALERVLTSALIVNAIALAVNLLPSGRSMAANCCSQRVYSSPAGSDPTDHAASVGG